MTLLWWIIIRTLILKGWWQYENKTNKKKGQISKLLGLFYFTLMSIKALKLHFQSQHNRSIGSDLLPLHLHNSHQPNI